jgi:hypothetical protein
MQRIGTVAQSLRQAIINGLLCKRRERMKNHQRVGPCLVGFGHEARSESTKTLSAHARMRRYELDLANDFFDVVPKTTLIAGADKDEHLRKHDLWFKATGRIRETPSLTNAFAWARRKDLPCS